MRDRQRGAGKTEVGRDTQKSTQAENIKIFLASSKASSLKSKFENNILVSDQSLWLGDEEVGRQDQGKIWYERQWPESRRGVTWGHGGRRMGS